VRRLTLFLLLFFFVSSSVVLAGFDDLLREVLIETGNQAIGTDDYVFSPGDVVIKKDEYQIYYSGSEFSGNSKVLLLTLLTSRGGILLKYPNPGTINVKSYQLQVISFDNNSLRVKVLAS